MASISISATIPRSCTSRYVTKKHSPPAIRARASSLGTKQETHIVTSNSESQKHLTLTQKEDNPLLLTPISRQAKDEKQPTKTEASAPKFSDKRWKNGTWDLNLFIKHGKMDWHAMIFAVVLASPPLPEDMNFAWRVIFLLLLLNMPSRIVYCAEARRRRFLELYPEAATNQEPVIFRSSIIPGWAWITHSHLAEAELLNGRAAMVGFFMSYLVDALTRLDVVGQTGNFMGKAALFLTVIGVILFRRQEDFENLQRLADEATFYDKQWQASWQDQNDRRAASD